MEHEFRHGDVVSYTSERPDRWCREETAIGYDRTGCVVLLDTYWGSGGDLHRLTAAEIASAELEFNLDDYDELDRYSHSSPVVWKRYAPVDRQVVTSQHGLQRRWFVRKGSTPDWATQIDNARQEVDRCESGVESARRSAEWARQELDRLIAAAAIEARS